MDPTELDPTKEALQLIITRGLPGSGKSTWAREFVRAHHDFVRVCRDDIRYMLYGMNTPSGREFERKIEAAVCSTRDHLIAALMCDVGKNVVVDECCVHPKILSRLWNLADTIENQCKQPVKIEFKSFFDVPLEVCISRNAERPECIPEHAIRSMYKIWKSEEKERQSS